VREETGHRAGRLDPLGWIWTTPGFTDERIWLYLATELQAAEQRLDHDEVLTVARMPLDEAIALARGGEIVDAKSVCALARAAHRLGA
jgi:ADP-ribose pyrophosphatase